METKTTPFPRRALAQQGELCNNLFDCFGILNCCAGIGPNGKGLCYLECNKPWQAPCSVNERCAPGLICCSGLCYNESEYSLETC